MTDNEMPQDDAESKPSSDHLQSALKHGDLARVKGLIEAGAPVQYRQPKGYNALIDATYSVEVDRNPDLVAILKLLVDHGVELSAVSDYGESAVRVLSRHGRFDAVRYLLEAGADKSQLKWSPLHEAVAIGSLADVQTALAAGESLEERDCWTRTAFHLALLVGDLEKASLLLDHGADQNACGRCGVPPMSFAVQGRHHEAIRWLIQHGHNIDKVDEFGETALVEAVQQDDLEGVNILLDAGANIEHEANAKAIRSACSHEIIMRLLDAGANPAKVSHDGQRIILGLGRADVELLGMASHDDFCQASTRSFGRANPEQMSFRFWEAMIRSGVTAYQARRWFGGTDEPPEQPGWCADRFGQSLTLLPDGRAIQIGGEHEDFYDPDFCIYNDVFLYEPDGTITIYGYPEDVFPPTDFHTATIMDDSIYIIGSLGYAGKRPPGATPVYRLNLADFRIDRLDTQGDQPGRIFNHRSAAQDTNEIRVWGGDVISKNDRGETHEENHGVFVLDLNTLRWRRESQAISPSMASDD